MVEDFATLRQTYSRLEDRVSTYQQETNDKILSLRNTLNTLQVRTHILCDLKQMDKHKKFWVSKILKKNLLLFSKDVLS